MEPSNITNFHKERDGEPGVAQLKTRRATFTCPVIQLYPLEQDLSSELVPAEPVAPNEKTTFKQRPSLRAARGSV